MKTIEIQSSQNVVLQFDLASIQQRFLATLIDLMIVGMLTYIVTLASHGSETAIYIFAVPFMYMYHLSSEIFNKGQSIGKMALKIRVVSLEGKDLSIKSILIRWAFRLIDIAATLGCLALISVFSSSKNQRIGDILAGTTVVSIQSNLLLSIKKIKNLSQSEHKIVYPEVTKYTDQDMLTVKNTLQRLERNPSPEARHAASLLIDKLTEQLDIRIKEKQKISFLRQILRDYIMLTR